MAEAVLALQPAKMVGGRTFWKAIGGDCAGAVSLVVGDQVAEPDAVEWLEQDQLSALLDDLPQRPMLAQRDGLRLSLAGAQNKLPVVVDGGRIGLPLGSSASTHILKPAIAAVEGSVINEAFCMALGQAMGLQVADTEILAVGDRQVLVVGRYDRRRGDGARWLRLHQEDVCQALGIPPELKYQNEGGPDLKACFELFRKATRPSAPQVIRLLDAVVFNALIGNHDAHAKNFSLLYDERTPTLAPLYDLLCTAVYPTLTAKMAMKLGSNTASVRCKSAIGNDLPRQQACRGPRPESGCYGWRRSFPWWPVACKLKRSIAMRR